MRIKKDYPFKADSGIDWLGEIPKHWEVKKFRYLFEESSEKIENKIVGVMLSVSGYRGIEIKQYEDENQKRDEENLVGYRIARPGQLVVNTMWLNYTGLGVSNYEGYVSPAYRCYWIDPILHRAYVHHLLRSSIYVIGYTKYLSGIRPNSLQISRDDLMGFPVLVPPAAEQEKIATFLDRETGKLDLLIREQRELIALLQEKRQTLISNAVTKGLNPKAKMKDSGVEWLGEVPEHWAVKKMGYVLSLKSGDQITSEEIEEFGNFPVYGGNGLRGYTSNYTHDGYYALIGRQGALCGNINFARGKFWASEHAVVVSPLSPINTKWVGELLREMNLNQYSVSAAQPGLSVEIISALKIVVPPMKEQDEIASYIEEKTSAIDELIHESEETIKLMQEHRACLISEVVTGKIDVRHLA